MALLFSALKMSICGRTRDFQVGRSRVRPQIDIFNALNNNAITQVNTTFGPTLLQPQSVLNPRLIRLNVRVTF